MIGRALLAGLAVVTLLAASCARTEEATDEQADRTVIVVMKDNHFEPDTIMVNRGEEVAFRFTNDGSTRHDAFIGDKDAQARHEMEARQMDGEHGGHHAADDPDAITLEPNERGTLRHTFDEEGIFEIGCHEPGHYAGGMTAEIKVGPANPSAP